MNRAARLLGVAGLLVLGASVFAVSLSRQFGGPLSSSDADGETLVVEEGSGDDDAPPSGADLLAAYGSHRAGQPVADPFVWQEATATVAATPAGEVAPTTNQPFEPLPLTVTLVLLADPVARAVVDARVVGPGDEVAAGVVTRVTREGIEVRNGIHRLFYELRRPWPRGYDAPETKGDDNPGDNTTEGTERNERK